jgi:threonine dehydrogenase-like Zn-dependent dehydrogenase
MRAIAVTPGRANSARPLDVPSQERGKDEYLVRMLEVGIDGTDREIDAGEYGEAPPGEGTLVIGHESLGEVVEECPGERCFREGDLVVATVRRPCPERCLNCRNGEYDFCLTGHYREHGIKGRHGFLREFYAERPEFLVGVPPELRSVAVLLEPLSIAEKVFRQTYKIQERMLWEPVRAIVTGAGGMGMLAALLARLRGLETLVYSRSPAVGARGEILGRIGAEYAKGDERTLTEAAAAFGAPDLVVEATGFSPLAWEAAGILHRNGVACLLSVTGGERTAVIPSDRLNRELVLGNRLVFGSVSAHRLDFEQGVADLRAIQERWPGALERFVTRRLPMERIREALDGPEDLKTVLEVAPGGARA